MTKKYFVAAALIALSTASADAFAKNHSSARAGRGVAQFAEARELKSTLLVKFSSLRSVDSIENGVLIDRVSGIIESVQTVGMADDAVDEAQYVGLSAVIEHPSLRPACVSLATAAVASDRKFIIELVDATAQNLRLVAGPHPSAVVAMALPGKYMAPKVNCALVRE